jgi:HEAT repeat protein
MTHIVKYESAKSIFDGMEYAERNRQASLEGGEVGTSRITVRLDGKYSYAVADARALFASSPAMAERTSSNYDDEIDESVEGLIADLKNKKDPYARTVAADLLGFKCSLPANAIFIIVLPSLVEALKDKDPDVREAAAYAIGNIGPAAIGVVPSLIKALKDENPDVREAAIYALGGFGSAAASAIPALIKALKDKSWVVRVAAANTFEEMGPQAKAAVPALSKALKDKHPFVQEAAAISLGTMGPEAKAAVPALAKALEDEYSMVREAAARALGNIGPAAKGAVPALIKTLEECECGYGVAVVVAKALGNIGPAAKAAVPALTEALNDEESDLRKAAAKAIEKIEGQSGD